MFIRRLFYDLTTGAILQSYTMQGDIIIVTAEEDAEFYGLENWGVFEWLEPDEQIEKNFSEAYGVTVDVGKEPHELVFDFTPPPPEPEPYDEMADMVTALNIMGVSVDG